MSSRARQKQASRVVREMRARERRRRRTLWTSAVAAIVLLIAGVAGVVAWQASRPGNTAAPAAATEDGTGFAVGTGPVTVEVYFDFLCPSCRRFEEAAAPTLDRYLAEKKITLVYRPIAILDQASTTRYSTRAGAAGACAAERGKLRDFVTAMMARQPAEGTAGLSDDEIVEIGAGAGLTDAGFGECVRGDAYHDWLTGNTEAAAGRGIQSTPTVLVNGERLENPTPERLTAAIAA
jgi:protein-disulfide isomerase